MRAGLPSLVRFEVALFDQFILFHCDFAHEMEYGCVMCDNVAKLFLRQVPGNGVDFAMPVSDVIVVCQISSSI